MKYFFPAVMILLLPILQGCKSQLLATVSDPTPKSLSPNPESEPIPEPEGTPSSEPEVEPSPVPSIAPSPVVPAPTAKDVSFLLRAGESITFKLSASAVTLVTQPSQLTATTQVDPVTGESSIDLVIPSMADGLDQLTYYIEQDGLQSAIATVDFYIVGTQSAQAFWLRNKKIQDAGDAMGEQANGSVIPQSAARDEVTQILPTFLDQARTPRYKAQVIGSKPALHFEFVSGNAGAASNDYFYYPACYVFAPQDGMTFFTVAQSLGPTHSIAPVVALGDWLTEGYGISWSSTFAGVGSPLTKGGADNRAIAAVTAGPHLLTSEIVFAKNGVPGFQRVRWDGYDPTKPWINGSTSLTLQHLTGVDLDELTAPSASGGPLMMGANNDAASQSSRRFHGYIAEVLILGKKLTAQEMRVIDTALGQEFGFTH